MVTQMSVPCKRMTWHNDTFNGFLQRFVLIDSIFRSNNMIRDIDILVFPHNILKEVIYNFLCSLHIYIRRKLIILLFVALI